MDVVDSAERITLVDLRTEQGLTQGELAAAVGLTMNTISKAERGESISKQSANVLCRFFKRSIKDIEGLNISSRPYVRKRARTA